MKIQILLSGLFFAGSVFAAARNEVFHTTGIINVADLQCVTRFVPDQTDTSLSDHRFPIYAGPEAEMKHHNFKAVGCDIPELRKIVEDARRNFMHVLNAPVKIVKKQSESFVNGFGTCMARYEESVEITLGSSTVITSEVGELLSRTDCP